jgi:hypothetical protein
MSAPRLSKLNAEWHRAHRMPRNPTLEQRLAWHKEHSQHCQCRPAPPSLLAALGELERARKGKRRTG